METFRAEPFCLRVRIFGNDRRNDYAFAFCDETIYRKKAPASAAVLERFAVLDPYTNERLYARKINFFAVKAE